MSQGAVSTPKSREHPLAKVCLYSQVRGTLFCIWLSLLASQEHIMLQVISKGTTCLSLLILQDHIMLQSVVFNQK